VFEILDLEFEVFKGCRIVELSRATFHQSINQRLRLSATHRFRDRDEISSWSEDMLSRNCCLTLSTLQLFRTQTKESKVALLLSLPFIFIFDPTCLIKLSRPDTPLRHMEME
jgi:hypothetical protein